MNTTESTTPALNRAGRRSLARTGSALGGAGVLVAGSAAALLTAFAGSAGAASTITVDSNADGVAVAGNCSDITPGNCTLRDAAALAVDGDTINFDSSISSITLTNGMVTTQAVSITGPGAAALTITTTAAPYSYDTFRVTGTGDAVISGVTITKNRVKALNAGKFTLDHVTISGSTSGYGGALYTRYNTDLEIIHSNFENNTGYSGAGALHIWDSPSSVTISDSTFTNNHSDESGGALYMNHLSSSFTMVNSVMTGNSAGDDGGAMAIRTDVGAVTTITDSTFDSNHADRNGGAIMVQSIFNGANAIIDINNSTISNNTAKNGAGLLLFSNNGVAATIDATVNNSTIAGNAAVLAGGGIYISANSSLSINQSTISANSAAGTYLSDGGGGITICDVSSVVTMSGSIVSGNTSVVAGAADFGLYSGNVSDSGSFTATNSLIGEVDSRITANGTNNITSTDPMLGALADNGGLTKTMAPLTGSPAIDAGPNPVATFTGNSSDQRGTPWVRVYNGTSNIGAVEVQPDPNAPTTTTTTTTSTTAGTDEPLVPAFTG